MRSGELANKCLDVWLDAAARITGVGNDQYADEDGQMFEKETVEDTLNLLEEELLDQMAYAAMTILKIRERRSALLAASTQGGRMSVKSFEEMTADQAGRVRHILENIADPYNERQADLKKWANEALAVLAEQEKEQQ